MLILDNGQKVAV